MTTGEGDRRRGPVGDGRQGEQHVAWRGEAPIRGPGLGWARRSESIFIGQDAVVVTIDRVAPGQGGLQGRLAEMARGQCPMPMHAVARQVRG